MNLGLMMQNGISGIMKTIGRFYLGNKKGRAFLADTLPRVQKSAARRRALAGEGLQVPPFLIASIASQCNLHCAGCYARAGGACCSNRETADLTAAEWEDIFAQAAGLGSSFALLAGGEPLLRRDVVEAAARRREMIFPIFTNGTMIDDTYLALFDEHRNLIPVFSVEGDAAATDARRGGGVHAAVEAVMAQMAAKSILFGASVTVTRENLDTVLDEAFVAELRQKGCGILFYVEYVPVEAGTEALALTESEVAWLQQASSGLKARFGDMVILSFPGDEEAMGGCLASGRGFFHINPKGGAEPCPFSPYAKYNLRETPMRAVLESGYFEALREIAAVAGPYTGGCVLFEREREVQALLAR